MSSAHGAGLDAAAVRDGVARMRASGDVDADAERPPAARRALIGWLMVGVHTLGYVLTMHGDRAARLYEDRRALLADAAGSTSISSGRPR